MTPVIPLPPVLAPRDPCRHAVAVRGRAALVAAKALPMAGLRQGLRLSFGVSDARFAARVRAGGAGR